MISFSIRTLLHGVKLLIFVLFMDRGTINTLKYVTICSKIFPLYSSMFFCSACNGKNFGQNKVKQSSPATHHGGTWPGRGSIAPTHSRPRHYMGVRGQCHAPATLDPWYPLDRRLGGPQSQYGHRLEEKSFCLCQGSNLDCPVHSQTLY
jgi:hypothetical protein